MNETSKNSYKASISDDLFKALTGNSTITPPDKDAKPIEFKLDNPDKFIICSGDYDQLVGRMDRGYERRWKIIKFHKPTLWERIINWTQEKYTIDGRILDSIGKPEPTLFQRVKRWLFGKGR